MKPAIILGYIMMSAASPQMNAIELGYYSIEQPESGEIFALEENADRVISCDDDLKLDVGLGKIKDGSREVIRLSFEDVKSFLSNERHKALLVFRFDKTIMMKSEPEIREKIALINSWVKPLGYARVVILGDRSSGVTYFSDVKK